MNRDRFEDDIRAALHDRASHAPTEPRVSGREAKAERRPRLLLAGAAAVLVLSVTALAVSGGDAPERVASGDVTPTTIRPAGNYLTFDLPGFRYLRVDNEHCRSASRGPDPSYGLDSFGTSYYESPILFVQTVPDFGPDSNFGLLDEEHGEPVTIRGVDGWALRERGPDRAWLMSALLPDGDAILVIVLGLDTEQAVAMVDSLERQPDGAWDLPSSPLGVHRLEPTRSQPGCGYGAAGEGFQVTLYVDAFDSRIADRISSTVGVAEPIDLAGLPGVIGSYRDDDHWVMAEPAPGLTLEIRASGMTRAETIELVSHARFVDEAGWRAVHPEDGSKGPSGTATPDGGLDGSSSADTAGSTVSATTSTVPRTPADDLPSEDSESVVITSAPEGEVSAQIKSSSGPGAGYCIAVDGGVGYCTSMNGEPPPLQPIFENGAPNPHRWVVFQVGPNIEQVVATWKSGSVTSSVIRPWGSRQIGFAAVLRPPGEEPSFDYEGRDDRGALVTSGRHDSLSRE